MNRFVRLVASIVLAGLAGAGCATQQRRFAFPPSPPRPAAATGDPATQRTWFVDSVDVDVAAAGGELPVDWLEERRAARARLTRTLEAQSWLGRRVEDRSEADLALSLDATYAERADPNGYAILASATGLAALGGGVWGAVELWDDTKLGAVGAVVGALIVGSIVSSAFPKETYEAAWRGEVRLVDVRTEKRLVRRGAEAAWRADVSGWGGGPAWAEAGAPAFAAMERELMQALHEDARHVKVDRPAPPPPVDAPPAPPTP